MKTMNRLMLKSYKCFEPQVVDIPEPKKGEVLVKVSHLGVCGSDISAYYGKQPYIPFPIVLGHELSGWVEKVGPDTEALPVGTRVTVLPHVPCRHCKACAEQRYNHCMKLLVIGCQTTGAQAEYLIAPADMIFELPESITMEQGAMVEPMAVTYHGRWRHRPVRHGSGFHSGRKERLCGRFLSKPSGSGHEPGRHRRI